MASNAIVLIAKAGKIVHQFCDPETAKSILDAARLNREGAASFVLEDGTDAGLYYSISPDFRQHVAEAKVKLERDLRIEAAFEKHGVPNDPEIRMAAGKAVRELLGY